MLPEVFMHVDKAFKNSSSQKVRLNTENKKRCRLNINSIVYKHPLILFRVDD